MQTDVDHNDTRASMVNLIAYSPIEHWLKWWVESTIAYLNKDPNCSLQANGSSHIRLLSSATSQVKSGSTEFAGHSNEYISSPR